MPPSPAATFAASEGLVAAAALGAAVADDISPLAVFPEAWRLALEKAPARDACCLEETPRETAGPAPEADMELPETEEHSGGRAEAAFPRAPRGALSRRRFPEITVSQAAGVRFPFNGDQDSPAIAPCVREGGLVR